MLNRRELWLFLFLWGVYAYFFQGSQDNAIARFEQTRSIVEHGVLFTDPFHARSADVIWHPPNQPREKAYLYSNKAPGLSFAGVIPYFISKKIAELSDLPSAVAGHFTGYFIILFTVGLSSTLCSVCVYRFLHRLSENPTLSMVITLAYALGTLALPYSTMFFSHQFAAALSFFFFYMIFSVKNDVDQNITLNKRHVVKITLGSLAGGYAFATEFPTALVLGFILIYAFGVFCSRRLHRLWLLTLLAFLAGLLPLVFYNLTIFDQIWHPAYTAYATENAKIFAEHKQGYLGVQNPFTNPNFLSNLYQITFGAQRGLFYCNPVLVLVIPGYLIGFILFYVKGRQISGFLPTISQLMRNGLGEFLLSFCAFSAFLIFNASYGNSIVFWGGGACTGPRHIVPVLPFLVIPLLLLARFDWGRWLFYAVLSVSLFFSYTATVVDPRSPYEFKNPVFQYHIPYFMASRNSVVTTGPYSDHLMTHNSTAFNMGKLIGLPAELELIPLMLFCLLMLFPLFRCGHSILPVVNTCRDWGVYSSTADSLNTKAIIAGTCLLIIIISLTPIFYSIHQKHVFQRSGGLTARYYPSDDFSGEVQILRKDSQVDFLWVDSLPLRNPFSVLWEGQIKIKQEGFYHFKIASDDASWLYINGKRLISNPGVHAVRERTGMVFLKPGKHNIRLRFVNYQFGAVIKLYWKPPYQKNYRIVPQEVLDS